MSIPKNCEKCGLYHNGFIKDLGNVLTCDYIVVGEAPNKIEVQQGRTHFADEGGQLLKKILGDKNEYFITNVCLCSPVDTNGNNRSPTTKEKGYCKYRVLNKISKAKEHNSNFKGVILLGGLAASLVTTKKLTNGTTVIKDDVVYHMFYSQSYILRNRGKMMDWYRDIDITINFSWDEFLQDKQYIFVTDINFELMYQDLLKSDVISIDIETNHLKNLKDDFKIRGVGFSPCDNRAYWVNPDSISSNNFERLKRDIIANNKIKKIGQAAKFDIMGMLMHWGVGLQKLVGDTLVSSFLVDERTPHNLEYLIGKWLPSYMGCKKSAKSLGGFENIDDEALGLYCCGDADATRKIYFMLEGEIKDSYKKTKTVKKIKAVEELIILPSIYLLIELEKNGMYVSNNEYLKLKHKYEVEIERLTKEIKKWGITNFRSTPQIRKFLFKDCGLKPFKKTDTQEDCTDKTVLERYRNENDGVFALYALRRIGGIYSTFLKPVPELIHKDKCIHSSYTYCLVVSGRFSSTAPNLQNLPRVDTDIDFINDNPIKGMYISRFGDNGVLLEADYSQIEVRLMAAFAKAHDMCEALAKGLDIHQYVADNIGRNRTFAKRINFGMIFRISAYALARDLNISQREAEEMMKLYRGRFHEVQDYGDVHARMSEVDLYSYTKFGRRRLFGGRGYTEKQLEEIGKQGMNLTIQGPAHDILIVAACRIKNYLKKSKRKNGNSFRAVLCNVIHDSIIFDCPDREEAAEVAAISKHIMKEVPSQLFKVFDVNDIPDCAKKIGFFDVDVKLGNNWAVMVKLSGKKVAATSSDHGANITRG